MTFQASAPGEFGNLRLASAEISFNTAGGTVDLDDLAAGDTVVQCWADVEVAFNAGTTNVLVLGDGTTANKFLAAGDITETATGVTPAGGKGPFAQEAAAGTLRATFTQTGTAATTGRARLFALISSQPA